MVGQTTLFWVFFLLIHFDVSTALSSCYAPDGSIVTDPIYQPCISIEGVESMCCRLNDTINIPDQCLPSGLCYTNVTAYEGFWRDYCTDPTWKSPHCLSKDICSKGGTSSTTNILTLCPDSKWCCGSDISCCQSSNTFTLEPTLINFGTAATATVTSTGNASSSNNSSTEVAIGAGVGVPLAVVALAMLGVGFWWGTKRASTKYKSLQSLDGDFNMSPGPYPRSGAFHEVSGNSKLPIELPDTGKPKSLG